MGCSPRGRVARAAPGTTLEAISWKTSWVRSGVQRPDGTCQQGLFVQQDWENRFGGDVAGGNPHGWLPTCRAAEPMTHATARIRG